MRLLILANVRSGRGRGASAEGLAAKLRSDRHEVRVIRIGPGAGTTDLAVAAVDCDVIVVAGGDGSLHHTADLAIQCGKPVYHLPCGNENLFAREFGMSRRIDHVRRALSGGRIVRADVLRATPDAGGPPCPVLLMASFGPDAHAIHRLHASRTRASGHLAYVRPTIREALHPSFPRLTVDVDGRRLFEGRTGVLLIANSRQYGLRTNPAARARMDDGLLDVVFLPSTTTVGVLWWAFLSRLRLQERRRSFVWARGREARVHDASGRGLICQIDGEAAFLAAPRPPTTVEFRVEPGVLPVLAP